MLLLRPLRHRAVALLWGGLSLSAVGDQLYAVALVWVAVSVFGPAAGYLTALQAGCGLVAALVAGRWADGWDRRRAMAGADLARAAVLLLLVAAWTLRGAPPAAGMAVAIVVLATGEAVFRPALAALMPALLPDRSTLPAANALFDTTERTARLMGPGLVGLLGGVLPVVHFFTLDAATFLASAAAVLCINPHAAPARPQRGTLFGGFASVRTHRVLATALWLSAPINGLWFASLYLALPLLIEQGGITGPGGSGLAAFGLCISAYGCTNLGATLVVGSRALPARMARMIFGGKIVVGAGVAALALAAGAGLPGLMLASAVAAIGGPMSDIPIAVLRQTELPPGDIAAAMRAFMTMSYTGTLVAMAAAPSLAGLIGPAWLICGSGAAMAALGIVGWAHCGEASPTSRRDHTAGLS